MNFRSLRRRWARTSLALHIALASFLFGLVVAGTASAVGLWALAQQLDARAMTELEGKRDLLRHVLTEIPVISELHENGHRFSDLLVGHDDLHIALVDLTSGTVLESFSVLATQSVAMVNASHTLGNRIPYKWKADTGERLSTLAGEAPFGKEGAVAFYLTLDRRHDSGLLMGFVKATVAGVPVLLMMVALGGWLIARTALAPLRRFKRLAATIGARSLSRRVSSAGLPLELDELAREFNGMLARIDDGYRRLQEFCADLAHEMRTPVSTLMGRTQVALSQTRSIAELREVLEGNVDELDRLGTLIADMLFIARAEQNDNTIQGEPFDLEAEVERVVEYFRLTAEERQVSVEIIARNERGAQVSADRMLVQRAITNLLSNAIRHAYPDTTVRMELSTTADSAILAVVNAGDGIGTAHLDRIFDRFYRIDTARARLDGGTGLGLAIVRSIMSAHGGRVSVASDPGRQTRFTLEFPLKRLQNLGNLQ